MWNLARLLCRAPRDLGHWMRVLKGLKQYRKTGVTPASAYQSFVTLFCRTQGRSNDLLHAFAKRWHPPVQFSNANGVLGNLNNAEISEIKNEIQKNGYFIFPERLAEETCKQLMDFALKQKARVSPCPEGAPEFAVFDRDNPLSAGYRFLEEDIIDLDTSQKFIADPSILSIAQAYLGCEPVFSSVNMWWSSLRQANDVSKNELAQLYHFDMVRIKWLKFFFYLTDVGPENGPHCFVRGSHQTGNQPLELLRRGYQRISDEDMRKFYPENAFQEIIGPRGTIVAVDTRGFHKGKMLTHGDRLVYEIELSDNLFGGEFSRTPMIVRDTRLQQLVSTYPWMFGKFDLEVSAQTSQRKSAA